MKADSKMRRAYVRYPKPEQSLQHANNLASIGKEQEALESLHEAIKERRQKNWSEGYTGFMMKYVELCVILRNSTLAKDGFFQYRTYASQEGAADSIKKVVKHFLTLTVERVEEAQKASTDHTEQLEDLDAINSPERLLLCFVSNSNTQGRAEQVTLLPWLRFSWDVHRNLLEALRNNKHIEDLYYDVALKTFEFCVKYKRRNEFIRLSGVLRNHLQQITNDQDPDKYKNNDYRIKLDDAESVAKMQKIRNLQLDIAVKMGLWQQAFESAQDLQQVSKYTTGNELTDSLNYYDKMALVLLKSDNILFHAAALIQKYTACKNKEDFSKEEVAKLASQILLAVLSIPLDEESPTFLTTMLDMLDQQQSNVKGLVSILHLPNSPTRENLIKQVEELDIIKLAIGPVRCIYSLVESSKSPLGLAQSINAELKKMDPSESENCMQYLDALKKVVSMHVLRQLPKHCDDNSLDGFPLNDLEQIIPFYPHVELNNFIVYMIKRRFIKAKIDQCNNLILFKGISSVVKDESDPDYEEDRTLTMHEHIMRAHEDLLGFLENNDKHSFDPKELKIDDKWTEDSYCEYIDSLSREVDSQKESREAERQERARKKEEEKARQEQQERDEEAKREQEKLEKEHLERLKEDQLKHQREINALYLQREIGDKAYEKLIEDLGEDVVLSMDPECAIKEHNDRIDKEILEARRRAKECEKYYDYLVRGLFLEESKCYKQMFDEFDSTAEERYNEAEQLRVKREIEEHEKNVAEYNKLSVIFEPMREFLKTRLEVHKDDLAQLKDKWETEMQVAKKERLEEREAKRILDQKLKEEKARLKKEEDDKIEAERAEREKRHREHQEMMKRVREQLYGPPPERQTRAPKPNAYVPPGKRETSSEPWARGTKEAEIKESQVRNEKWDRGNVTGDGNKAEGNWRDVNKQQSKRDDNKQESKRNDNKQESKAYVPPHARNDNKQQPNRFGPLQKRDESPQRRPQQADKWGRSGEVAKKN